MPWTEDRLLLAPPLILNPPWCADALAFRRPLFRACRRNFVTCYGISDFARWLCEQFACIARGLPQAHFHAFEAVMLHLKFAASRTLCCESLAQHG